MIKVLKLNGILGSYLPTRKQIEFSNDILKRINGWLMECRAVSNEIVDQVEVKLNDTISVEGVFSVIDHLAYYTKETIINKCELQARELNSELYGKFKKYFLIQKKIKLMN